MYCSACGTKFGEDARFCYACGNPRPDTTATAPTMSPKRVLDLTLDQQSWIEDHKKSKGIAALLALLLTGAANLYAGQTGVGIFFLLVEFLIFLPLMSLGLGFILHFGLAVIALAIAVRGIDKHNASLYTDVLSKDVPKDSAPVRIVRAGNNLFRFDKDIDFFRSMTNSAINNFKRLSQLAAKESRHNKCPYCAEMIEKQARVCSSCGRKLHLNESTESVST